MNHIQLPPIPGRSAYGPTLQPPLTPGLIIDAPPRQQMDCSPGNTPPTSPREPLTPRGEERQRLLKLQNWSTIFRLKAKNTAPSYEKARSKFLHTCAYFIEHDCVSCEGRRLNCLPKVKMYKLGKSLKTVKKCADCFAASVGVCSCGTYCCYGKNNARVLPGELQMVLPD